MTIYKIKFKRTKESEWENGIAIERPNSEEKLYSTLYLDKNGNFIKMIDSQKWNIWDLVEENNEIFPKSEFCIDLTHILKD